MYCTTLFKKFLDCSIVENFMFSSPFLGQAQYISSTLEPTTFFGSGSHSPLSLQLKMPASPPLAETKKWEEVYDKKYEF